MCKALKTLKSVSTSVKLIKMSKYMRKFKQKKQIIEGKKIVFFIGGGEMCG